MMDFGYHRRDAVVIEPSGRVAAKRAPIDDIRARNPAEIFDHEGEYFRSWDTHHRLMVFKFDGGFGVYELTPAGWSSYTYDPEESLTVMFTDDYDTFKRMALTDEQRAIAAHYDK